MDWKGGMWVDNKRRVESQIFLFKDFSNGAEIEKIQGFVD